MSYEYRNFLGTKDSAKPVIIVDIIVIEVGTGVIAGYPRIVVVVLLAEPFVFLLSLSVADHRQSNVQPFLIYPNPNT